MEGIISEKERGGEGLLNDLKFSGNWFIDAGILGFVNLMEEVYGWNLGELQAKINENEKLVYYGYFPFAFIYDNLGIDNISYADLLKKRWVELKNKSDAKEIFGLFWKEAIHVAVCPIWISNKLFDKEGLRKPESLNKKGKKKTKEEYNDEILLQKLRKIWMHIDRLKSSPDVLELLTKDKVFSVKNGNKKDGSKRELLVKEADITALPNHFSSYSANAEIKQSLSEIYEIYYNLNKYLEKMWFDINKEETSNKKFFRIPLKVGSFTNFLMFNTSSDYWDQQNKFFSTISINPKENELRSIKKSVNKLLISPEEFTNELYCDFIPVQILKESFQYLFVYILCSQRCFRSVAGKRMLYYTNDLDTTNKIFQEIRLILNRSQQTSLFSQPWKNIFNILYEKKALWCVKSMYIINFGKYNNQNYESVSYLSISTLNSIIILDDTILENINKVLPCNKYRRESIFLMELLLNERPLFPFIFEHIERVISDDKVYLASSTSLYALMIDANKQKLGVNHRHFQPDFFKGYPSLIEDIKKDVSYNSYAGNALSDLFSDEKDTFVYRLLSAIKGKNKNIFLNTVCLFLIQKEDYSRVEIICSYLMKKIIQDECWQCYALALILPVVRKWKRNKN